MSDPSLELQKAIRSRLAASSAVTVLVPTTAIVDRNSRPEVFPCIVIGEGQTVADEGLARTRTLAFADLHIWKSEPGLAGCKAIAGAIRSALTDAIWTLNGFHVADLYVSSSRFLRDPDGLHSHGIVSLQAALVETA